MDKVCSIMCESDCEHKEGRFCVKYKSSMAENIEGDTFRLKPCGDAMLESLTAYAAPIAPGVDKEVLKEGIKSAVIGEETLKCKCGKQMQCILYSDEDIEAHWCVHCGRAAIKELYVDKELKWCEPVVASQTPTQLRETVQNFHHAFKEAKELKDIAIAVEKLLMAIDLIGLNIAHPK